MLDVYYIHYHGRAYPAIDVKLPLGDDRGNAITIASQSLNIALYSSEKGYPDKEAELLDCQIYGFLGDDSFLLDMKTFVNMVEMELN